MKSHTDPSNMQDLTCAAWQEQVAQAHRKPWLASLLLWQGERILRRFIQYYHQLCALPRNTRRLVKKRLATTLAGVALLLALAGPSVPAAQAATIGINPGSTGINGSDGGCSLVEAIVTANTGGAASADCSGGTAGADTITLAGNTYSYNAAYDGENALPPITSQITIDANNATIERSGGGQFRILQTGSGGNLTLNDATISGGAGGTTNVNGGGIYNYYGSVITVQNSVISGNATTGSGGGIFNYRGSLTVRNSAISYNTANNDGGGVNNYYYDSNLLMENSLVSGNAATTGDGGGIYINGTATIQNSTISGNSAASGGGIHNGGSYMATIQSSTISANSATTGGGIFGTASLQNSIIAKQTAGNDCSGTITSYGYNWEGAYSCGFGGRDNQDVNPNFLYTLSDNGGGTKTHGLHPFSMAVDDIPLASCLSLAADQRGQSRVDYQNDDGAVRCDSGAFELQTGETPTAITLDAIGVKSSIWSGLAALVTAVSSGLVMTWTILRRKHA